MRKNFFFPFLLLSMIPFSGCNGNQAQSEAGQTNQVLKTLEQTIIDSAGEAKEAGANSLTLVTSVVTTFTGNVSSSDILPVLVSAGGSLANTTTVTVNITNLQSWTEPSAASKTNFNKRRWKYYRYDPRTFRASAITDTNQ